MKIEMTSTLTENETIKGKVTYSGDYEDVFEGGVSAFTKLLYMLENDLGGNFTKERLLDIAIDTIKKDFKEYKEF